MRSILAFLFGLGIGLFLRASRTAFRPDAAFTTVPGGRVSPMAADATGPMADAFVATPTVSPLQAFLANYQQASTAAWDALGVIDTRLEEGHNLALEAQADALKIQIRAMAAIARDHAAQVLAVSGAVARLDGLTQNLTNRTAELPAATDAVKAATSVVGAAKSFVTFFG